MMDETFVFLSQPHIGTAYRQTNNSERQYCKNAEIVQFINDSINNDTLNKGVKYLGKNAIKYKYKFNKGSNKKSVSVIINAVDYPLYATEIISLNNNLSQNGYITNCNLYKINRLLYNPLALLTFTNEITINIPKKGIVWCLLIMHKTYI